MKYLSVLAALVALAGCGADPHRIYKGTVVRPLWIIPNIRVTQGPIVHDGLAYVYASAPGAPRNEWHLYALDLATRKQLWVSTFVPLDKIKYFVEQNLYVADDHGLGHLLNGKTGQEAAPAAETKMVKAVVADGIVYASWEDGTVTATKGTTKLWTAKTSMNPNNFFAPVLFAGNLYVLADFAPNSEISHGAGVYVFDIKNGDMRWKFEFAGDDVRSRQMQADATSVYATIEFQTADGHQKRRLFVLDAATGKEKWSFQAGARFMLDRPLLFDPSTVLMYDYPAGTGKNDGSFVIRALNAGTGATAWQSVTSYKSGEWQIHDGALYFADREDHSRAGMWMYPTTHGPKDSWLTRVDPHTGKEVWRSEVVENSSFTSPAFADGLILVGCDPGGLYAYRP
jgi:outer membrane protein assembly factor BamB